MVQSLDTKDTIPSKVVTHAPAVEALANLNPRLFIDGKFVDAASGKTFDNICPMNGKPMLAVAEGDKEDIDLAVKAARRAFEEGTWSNMGGRDRGKLLFKWADLLEQHLEELALLESVDVGKPFSVAKSGDIPGSINNLRYMAGWADKIQGHSIPTSDNTLCYTLKEPIGVVGAIVPWNFPLLTLMNKVAPALAAGCTVVVKCAEQTPLTALKSAELAAQAGIPAGVYNVVPGFGPTAGAALCNHPGVDKLTFTGSVEVGKLVMEAAAKRVCNVTLELGGKSPLIVCEDADVETAAQIAHNGLFDNAGQVCCASSRIYVHESICDAFLKRSKELAEAIKVGDPFSEDTSQGPQVDQQQFEKILNYVSLGQKQGAKLLCGGDKAADIGYYVKPTIFADVTPDMKIFQEEIFGPVMSVIKFKDIDEAIASANSLEFGLASGVVSTNIDTVNKVSRKLKAGTVWINCWNYFFPSVPFGGCKQSGIGREYGRESLENFLESKSVIIKS